jgi:chromosome segregation ATPase
MNGGSLLSYALYDGNNDDGTPDPKTKLREELAKGNVIKEENPEGDDKDKDADKDKEGDEEDEEEDEDNEEDEEEDDKEDIELTPEQKAEKEAKEKLEAKATRKQERMQRRIDRAIAEKKAAETEVAKLKAQLEASPDQKLTAEEIEAKAEAKAKQKLAEKELENLQDKFDKACETLAKAATKVDKDFNEKINELADDIGKIPSFMIGVLEDMENGGEVLAHIANDDELAEEIWAMRPTKMTKALVEISAKLEAAKKPPKKQISKVPDPGTPVKGNRQVSNTITEADAKNMDVYTRKRMAQIAEKRKAQGYN